MQKRKLHHFWVKIKPMSYWYFLVAFIISASVCTVALRNNNLMALKLHNQLTSADQNNSGVSQALNSLRQFTYSHMNTNLSGGDGTIYPPIQLKYTYQRLLSAEQAAAKSDNSKIYTDAENYCQKLLPKGFSGRTRVPCIEKYVTTHGVKVQPIPAALYEFDFVSPFWSPDLAGWSLLASAFFLLCTVVRFVLEKWLKHSLRNHL